MLIYLLMICVCIWKMTYHDGFPVIPADELDHGSAGAVLVSRGQIPSHVDEEGQFEGLLIVHGHEVKEIANGGFEGEQLQSEHDKARELVRR